MRVHKLIASVLLIIFCSMGITGCSTKSSNKGVVAFVQQTLNAGEFWDDISDNLKKELEASGFTYKVDGAAEWGADLQAEIINKFIDEKVEAIIVAPTGTSELFESFKRANDAGIEIILVDTDINEEHLASYGAEVTCFVGVDNYKCGQEVGKKVAEKLPKNSEVGIFSGGVENFNSEDRCNGFSDIVKAQGMNVVARNAVGQWTAEDGYSKAKIIFQAYPEMKAVFTANSNMCQGVFQAAEEYGVDIIGGSFDVDEAMMNKINNDQVICSLDQDSEAMSKKVCEVVKKCVNGEKVDRVVYSEGKLVTK